MTQPDLSLEDANEQYAHAVLDCIAHQSAILVAGGMSRSEAISLATETQRSLQEASSDPTGVATLEAETGFRPMPVDKKAQVLAIQKDLRGVIPHPNWL